MNPIPNTEARAEFLLALLDRKPSGIKLAGRYLKGYSADLVELSDDYGNAVVSRNGLRRVLPEWMFYREDYFGAIRDRRGNIREEEREALLGKLRRMKELYEVFFLPFDTSLFSRRQDVESAVHRAEVDRVGAMVKHLYGFDIEREHDPYMRGLLMLLPQAHTVKGNLNMLAYAIGCILQHQVQCRQGYAVHDEPPVSANGVPVRVVRYRKVRFVVVMKGLDSSQYRQQMQRLEPFFDFVQHWLLSFEYEMEYCVKDYDQRFILGQSLTLDYNTQFL